MYMSSCGVIMMIRMILFVMLFGEYTFAEACELGVMLKDIQFLTRLTMSKTVKDLRCRIVPLPVDFSGCTCEDELIIDNINCTCKDHRSTCSVEVPQIARKVSQNFSGK